MRGVNDMRVMLQAIHAQCHRETWRWLELLTAIKGVATGANRCNCKHAPITSTAVQQLTHRAPPLFQHAATCGRSCSAACVGSWRRCCCCCCIVMNECTVLLYCCELLACPLRKRRAYSIKELVTIAAQWCERYWPDEVLSERCCYCLHCLLA